jgi:trimethylamine:corrinoid methyltransferase-like protein
MDIRQRASVMAEKLLANPKPSYIPDEIDRAIREKFNILL